MKRQRHWDASKGGYVSGPRPVKKRRVSKGPVRTYPGSMVPLASRGYRLNDTELKVYDISTATYAINTTGTIGNIFRPVNGSDFNNRIGRKTCLKTLQIRGYIQNEVVSNITAATSTNGQLLRLIVLWDTQPNGAVPALTDVLTTAHPQAPLNLNNRDRFKVLRDKVWAMGPMLISAAATQSVAAWDTPQVIAIKEFIKLPNLETIYNASTGNVSDLSSGSLCFLWVGSEPNGSNHAEFVGTYRCRFQDA